LYETDDNVTVTTARTGDEGNFGRSSGDVESGYYGDQSEAGSDVRGSGSAMGDRMQTAALSNGTPNPGSASRKNPTKNESVLIGTLNATNLQNIARGCAKSAAQERLAKMRKRTSLRSQSHTEVSNIEAIVDAEGDVDREILNQLDEDELFDLIALQETRSVSSRGRQGGLHQIGLGPMRASQSTSRTSLNSANNKMTDSTITGGGSRIGSLSGSQSSSTTSSAVNNPLRNTAVAVNDNAAYGGSQRSLGPSNSFGGASVSVHSGRSTSTVPINISSVHSPRDSTIEEGDEMGVSPAANNYRLSKV
jgi:hypothetical protein